MAELNHQVNVEEAQKQGNGDDVLPPGRHLMECTFCDIKPTKAGNGSYIQVELTGVEGEVIGKRVTERFNWTNPNPKAVEIGKQQFDKLVYNMGLTSVTSTEALLGKRVGVESEPYEDSFTNDSGEQVKVMRNKIKKYLKPEGDSSQAQTEPPASAPASQQKPWG
jgi:hypothetical protein